MTVARPAAPAAAYDDSFPAVASLPCAAWAGIAAQQPGIEHDLDQTALHPAAD